MKKNISIRILDVIISFLTLLVFLPLFLVISILIKFTSTGPIFFTQIRVGKDLQKFVIYKFRTMYNDKSRFIGNTSDCLDYEELKKVRLTFITTEKNDNRITSVGRFLRSSSLDEIPQIFNVLKGDMSIVGPRPDTPVQIVDYNSDQWIQRHKIKPGITGLAQITGRSRITSSERIFADLKLVDSISTKLYLKIIFITFFQVLFKKQDY